MEISNISLTNFYKIFENIFKKSPNLPPETIYLGYIYVLRPIGEVCVVIDLEYSELSCYKILLLTGENQGQKKIIRKRDFIKGRKPTIEDIIYYKIDKYIPEYNSLYI